MSYFVCYIWLVTVATVHAYKYKMEFDAFELVTSRCEKFPDKPITSFVNMSNFSMEKKNEDVLIDGSATYIWNDGGQFERVEVRGVTERYQRGSWGPTTFNFVLPDMCAAIYDKTTPWYTAFFSHVKEEFRNCPYTKGYKMEFEPFTVSSVEIMIPGVDMTGKYRTLMYLIPYDKNNRQMMDSIYCFIVPIDAVRMG